MTTRGMTVEMPASACKKATGLTPAELETVVAVASCFVAERAWPTRSAIQQITGRRGSSTLADLAEIGALVRVDTAKDGSAIYAVAEAWLRELGLQVGEAAA